MKPISKAEATNVNKATEITPEATPVSIEQAAKNEYKNIPDEYTRWQFESAFIKGAKFMNQECSVSSLEADNLTPHQAKCILKLRDALSLNDFNEAYHWLYQIASPLFDKFEPWEDIKKIAAATPVKREGIEKLLALLAQYGGEIVSTAKLTPEWINQARASGRLYVDENSLGYVWEPDIKGFPTTEQEVEAFEKWYPLPVEMPEELKNADWLFKKPATPVKRDDKRFTTAFLFESKRGEWVDNDSYKEVEKKLDECLPLPATPASDKSNEAIEGCNVCGGKMAIIRGRYPKDADRIVCPTCNTEKLEAIESDNWRLTKLTDE